MPLKGKIGNITMEIFNMRLASTLLLLSREVLSDYTKLIYKVLKLYTRQRLGQHIYNLFIHANILEYQISMCFDLSWNTRFSVIFTPLWLSHRIMVASISRSNRPVNNFRSHMASQLVEHATCIMLLPC
jgi:hypothetical protein